MRNKNIIGLLLISLIAFLGFGFVFTKFEMNVGAEALAAAFGTLFIILSTKFLMEQESESKIQTEKQRELFSESLKKFQTSGSLMAGVLRDRQITVEELSQLVAQHANLMILGNQASIDRSKDFISKCREFLTDANGFDFVSPEEAENTYKNQLVILDSDQTKKLWEIAVDFMSAAREGLHLPTSHHADLSKHKVLFEELSTPADQVIKKAREPLAGGFDEWFELKKCKPEFKDGTWKTVSLLLQKCHYLTEKYSRSQISFADKDRKPKEINVMYINNITGQGQLRFVFGVGISEHTQTDNKTMEFFKSLADELNWAGTDAKVESRERNGKFFYNVNASINVAKFYPGHVEKLSSALDRMVDKYNRKPSKKSGNGV